MVLIRILLVWHTRTCYTVLSIEMVTWPLLPPPLVRLEVGLAEPPSAVDELVQSVHNYCSVYGEADAGSDGFGAGFEHNVVVESRKCLACGPLHFISLKKILLVRVIDLL